MLMHERVVTRVHFNPLILQWLTHLAPQRLPTLSHVRRGTMLKTKSEQATAVLFKVDHHNRSGTTLCMCCGTISSSIL
jgi:hypothetical protein